MCLRFAFAFVCLFAFSQSAKAAQYYFPIVATGFLPGSSDQFYVTEFVINNPSSKRIDGQLSFYSTDGNPLEFTLRPTGASASTDDSFPINIAAKGTWRAYTNDDKGLKTGWVILDTSDEVDPIAVFSLNSRTTGLLSEAAVFVSYPGMVQRLFGDSSRRSAQIPQLLDQTPSNTGIAIANTNSQQASVTIRLLDSSGQAAQSTQFTLKALASTSKFMTELFPAVTTFQGTLEIQSDVPVTALGLRITGSVMTTLPVSIIQ